MPADRPKPPVAVAVVSWNTRELLAACLQSLAPESAAGHADVWVVDNASTDGSAEMVHDRFPWVSLIASDENLGFGRAVNVVARRTATEWIAPANADTELTPGALEALVEAGEERADAAIIAPKLALPGGETQHSVHPFPTLGAALAFNLGIHHLSRRLGDRLTFEGSWDHQRPREVDWAIAAFLLVRRSAYEQVGGFDETHWVYAEDLDLAWRLRQAGWRTRYEPRAVVHHASSASATQAFADEIVSRWMAASYGWMARRRGLSRTWAWATINLAGAAVRVAMVRGLARVRPARFAPLRYEYRLWLRAHRSGFRSRHRLLGPAKQALATPAEPRDRSRAPRRTRA